MVTPCFQVPEFCDYDAAAGILYFYKNVLAFLDRKLKTLFLNKKQDLYLLLQFILNKLFEILSNKRL